MVSWKIALVVFVIAILVMAIGMWFGYQYVSEQDDLTPEGSREPPKTPNLCCDMLSVFALIPLENSLCNVTRSKYGSIFPIFSQKRRSEI